MRKLFQNDEERAIHRGWLQTAVSEQMRRWAMGLSRHPNLDYGSALNLFTRGFTEFLEKRPWEYGLTWREARSKTKGDAVQLNIELGDTIVNGKPLAGSEFAALVKRTADECGVSTRTFASTAVFYICAFKHPPKPRS